MFRDRSPHAPRPSAARAGVLGSPLRGVWGAVLGVALAALASCATPLPQVVPTGANTIDVRYDQQVSTAAEIDARARQYCGGAAVFVSGETRFDGFAYRTYQCAGR